MAIDWTLYEKLLGAGGVIEDLREAAIEGAVGVFTDGIIDDPAYQKDAVVEGEITPIVALRTSKVKCSIKAVPGSDIHIGDMVECLGAHWIVVELYTDKIGVLNGEMWLCNNAIRFQNQSPAVNTRFCVVDDGTYSKRSTDPDAFVMTNTYNVYITMDSATERIYVDKRLGFGEIYSSNGDKILEVYKVIGMDLKSKNYGDGSHLMVLTMQRDVYNAEADSISDNLCDVFKESPSTAAPSPTGSCTISGRDAIRIGTSKKYTAVYTDAEGTILDGVESVWDIIAPSGVTFDPSGDTCTINIPLDATCVGETVTVRVSDIEGLYGTFEKKVQVITVG